MFRNQIEAFENKFEISIDKDLKRNLIKVENIQKSYIDSYDFFSLNRPIPHLVDAFFTIEFIKYLIDSGFNQKQVEEAYYDFDVKCFDSKETEKLFENFDNKPLALIYGIGFAETCGGREILILNGPDSGKIVYDHHLSYTTTEYNGRRYKYISYLKFHNEEKTIFDLIGKG